MVALASPDTRHPGKPSYLVAPPIIPIWIYLLKLLGSHFAPFRDAGCEF